MLMKQSFSKWWLCLAWVVWMTRPDCSASNPALKFGFHHENVMGTSLEIQVLAGEKSQARRVESRVLEEMERLSSVLSTYDSNRAMSRWLAQDGARTEAPEILEVLARCEAFFQSTRGEGPLDPGHGLV